MNNSDLPAYEQVKAFIKGHIGSGQWKPGDTVPSESQLMTKFGIARMTVNRALRELASEGMVTRVQGSGTRVANLHKISSQLTIRDIHEEIIARGHQHTTRVELVAREKAHADIAKQLGMRTGGPVFHTILIHLENSIAIQFEDRFVNPAAAPDYLNVDFTKVTPTHHLLAHAPLTEATYSIEATMATPAQAKALGIKRTEPCLVMCRRTVSGANIASVARLVYPGSRYTFSGQFQA
jgi:GntR family transcriptional regulator, histidine utilization repressor